MHINSIKLQQPAPPRIIWNNNNNTQKSVQPQISLPRLVLCIWCCLWVSILWRSSVEVIFNEIIFLKWYHACVPTHKWMKLFYPHVKITVIYIKDLALSLLSAQCSRMEMLLKQKYTYILTIIYWAKENNNFIAYFIKNSYRVFVPLQQI